jgi:hypothetical protein
MPRFSAGCKTSAGSTSLPIISVYASASVSPKIREIGVFNTTSTAVDIKLTRMTTAGTQGTGLTEACHDDEEAAAGGAAFNTHSSTGPTLGDDLGYRASLGAAVGAGVIWTFGDTGIRVPKGTGNGVGVIVENGTGQACQAYIVWDE